MGLGFQGLGNVLAGILYFMGCLWVSDIIVSCVFLGGGLGLLGLRLQRPNPTPQADRAPTPEP